MKAEFDGIVVEGTPQEVNEFLNLYKGQSTGGYVNKKDIEDIIGKNPYPDIIKDKNPNKPITTWISTEDKGDVYLYPTTNHIYDYSKGEGTNIKSNRERAKEVAQALKKKGVNVDGAV